MMTQLRQRMLEELQRRNYSAGTIRLYLHHVAAFAQHFHRSPDQLGAEDIRRYQLFLIKEKKLAWSSYNQIVCALRFFYAKTLKRAFLLQDIPFPRREQRLPLILSQEEVARILSAPSPPQKPCPVDDHLRHRLAALRGGPLASQGHRLGTHDRHRLSRERKEGSRGHVVPGFAGDLAAVLAAGET